MYVGDGGGGSVINGARWPKMEVSPIRGRPATVDKEEDIMMMKGRGINSQGPGSHYGGIEIGYLS